MVDRNISITTSVDRAVSITTSVDRDVSVPATVDTATSPYAPIVATNPALFVPLLYASTSADGQILYQDSAATTPVTSPGDPVGDVAWTPNTFDVEQPTDASRPVWQGSTTGTSFDRASSQFLDSSGAEGELDFVHNDPGCSIAFTSTRGSTSNAVLFCGNSISNSVYGHTVRWDSSGNLLFRIFGNSTQVEAGTSSPITSDTNLHSYVIIVNSGSVDFYKDDSLFESVSWTHPDYANAGTREWQLGRVIADTQYHNGDVIACAYWDRVITPDEITTWDSVTT